LLIFQVQYPHCVEIKLHDFSVCSGNKGLITCNKIGEWNENSEVLQPLKVWDHIFEEKPVFWTVKSLQGNKSVTHGFQKLTPIPNVSTLQDY